MSEYVTIFDKTRNVVQEIPEEDRAMNFSFELDAFQKEGIYRIYQKENVFITAHTGSGKTVLALYAIAECFRLNKKVIYTSPTKSLSNQKYAEFMEKFGDKNKIGILTGDIKMNPDAPCLIMTTEILRNMLYRDIVLKEKGIQQEIHETSLRIEDIGAVVFDEVHYINDPERGRVWEEVFILLPREVTLVLLSATIDKPEEFAGWLGDLKQKQVHLIPTSHRVVPLRHYFWNVQRESMTEMLMEDGRFKNYDVVKNGYRKMDINKIMNGLLKKLERDELLPVLFFTFSRKKCERLCQSVQGLQFIDHKEEAEVRRIFEHYMHPYKNVYECIPQYQEIYSLLRRGIAYHHSGLIPILKEIVEIIFGRGLIRVLFATETFAVGVNMPTKTVVFSELEKYDKRGRRYLRTDEYLQMSGRAGRRGLDKVGTVILLPTMDLPEMSRMRDMMTGKSPCIKSQFIPTYQFLLKTQFGEEGMDFFLNKTLRSCEDEKYNRRLKMDLDEKEVEYRNRKEEYERMGEEWICRMEKYEGNVKRLNDTYMVLKGKDRKRVEDEQREMNQMVDFQKKWKEYQEYKDIEDEYLGMKEEYEYYEKALHELSEKMLGFLGELRYIQDGVIQEKGITAMSIGEVDEILMTEMIHGGYLDRMTFEEIVTTLSMFVNEIDKSGEEKNIGELEIPSTVKNVYREMIRIANEMQSLEDQYKIDIHPDDYYMDCVSMDLMEPAWIWVNGGTIQELHQNTEMYAGNFVRGMLRLNQICDTFMKICIHYGKLDVAQKMEGYQERLIRDFTSVISLYVR